jgi:hypothetical protein
MATTAPTEPSIRTFAFVVDGEVVGTLTIPAEAPNSERLWAGLSSDPKVIESTSTPGVQYGWTWDGTSFNQGV